MNSPSIKEFTTRCWYSTQRNHMISLTTIKSVGFLRTVLWVNKYQAWIFVPPICGRKHWKLKGSRTAWHQVLYGLSAICSKDLLDRLARCFMLWGHWNTIWHLNHVERSFLHPGFFVMNPILSEVWDLLFGAGKFLTWANPMRISRCELSTRESAWQCPWKHAVIHLITVLILLKLMRGSSSHLI